MGMINFLGMKDLSMTVQFKKWVLANITNKTTGKTYKNRKITIYKAINNHHSKLMQFLVSLPHITMKGTRRSEKDY